MKYGQDKWICETQTVKRWGYRLFGELHVPGRLRSNHILRQLQSVGLSNRSIRVLDAGSGRGDLAIFLARKFPHWQVLGVDASSERVAIARHAADHLGLTNVRFETGSLERLSFEDEFGLIINADVLEHIEDDRLVLRNLFRALRPGGHLIVTSPSIPQRKHLPLVRWREKRIGFHPSDYGHVRDGYSKDDIREKFVAAGGHVTYSLLTYGFFGTLAFDLFFVIGDNRPNPVVFAALFPFLLGLAWLDLHFLSDTGCAILAVGTKGEGKSREAVSRGEDDRHPALL